VKQKCGTFYSPAYVRALAVINRSEAKAPLAIGCVVIVVMINPINLGVIIIRSSELVVK
jgi:hypothetical protein